MANADKATQEKFNKIVDDLRIDMSLESAVSEALRQMREMRQGKKGGGRDKDGVIQVQEKLLIRDTKFKGGLIRKPKLATKGY